MSYQWDPAKARANRAKHGISFADAVAVFEDPRSVTLDDPHPEEDRYVTVGLEFSWSSGRRVLDLAGRRGPFDLGQESDQGRATRVSGGVAMRNEYDFKKGKRGAVLPAPAGKTRITIRLDDDILEWFRHQADAAGGGNYQSMINEALRTVATEGPAKLETVVRRVVREELKRVGEPRRSRRVKAA